MSAIAWFQLALGFVKLANWAASYVDEQTWKAAGRREAMDEQAAALKRSIEIRDSVKAATNAKSPEEILRELEGNKELRED